MPKQYMLTAPAYLRLKTAPKGDPVYIPSDTLIGEDTPFDFDGPPTLAMSPVGAEAEREHADYLETMASGIPMTVKGGAAQPFDPADPNSNSAAEKEAGKKSEEEAKKREEDLKAREEALAKREEDAKKAFASDVERRQKELDKQRDELAAREKKLLDAEAKAKADTAKTPQTPAGNAK